MTPLFLEDSRAGLYRLDPDGKLAEITSEIYRKGAEACLNAPADLTVDYFARHPELAPIDLMAWQKCAECEGKGYVRCLVVREYHDGETSTVGRFRGDDLDDVRELATDQTVGLGDWDCDECVKGGVRLVATGAQVTVDELRGRMKVAA